VDRLRRAKPRNIWKILKNKGFAVTVFVDISPP
jgi:hypothetical protein